MSTAAEKLPDGNINLYINDEVNVINDDEAFNLCIQLTAVCMECSIDEIIQRIEQAKKHQLAVEQSGIGK